MTTSKAADVSDAPEAPGGTGSPDAASAAGPACRKCHEPLDDCERTLGSGLCAACGGALAGEPPLAPLDAFREIARAANAALPRDRLVFDRIVLARTETNQAKRGTDGSADVLFVGYARWHILVTTLTPGLGRRHAIQGSGSLLRQAVAEVLAGIEARRDEIERSSR